MGNIHSSSKKRRSSSAIVHFQYENNEVLPVTLMTNPQRTQLYAVFVQWWSEHFLIEPIPSRLTFTWKNMKQDLNNVIAFLPTTPTSPIIVSQKG